MWTKNLPPNHHTTTMSFKLMFYSIAVCFDTIFMCLFACLHTTLDSSQSVSIHVASSRCFHGFILFYFFLSCYILGPLTINIICSVGVDGMATGSNR